LTNYFIQTTRRAHSSLMQSPRPDVGYYLDIALKNASNPSHPLSKVNNQFLIIFHIPIAYTTLKKHFFCKLKMARENFIIFHFSHEFPSFYILRHSYYLSFVHSSQLTVHNNYFETGRFNKTGERRDESTHITIIYHQLPYILESIRNEQRTNERTNEQFILLPSLPLH